MLLLYLTSFDTCYDTVVPSDKSQQALMKRRQYASVRALRYILKDVTRGPEEDFEFHAGDIAFLVRNIIYNGTDKVSEAADKVVRTLIKRYDRSVSCALRGTCFMREGSTCTCCVCCIRMSAC